MYGTAELRLFVIREFAEHYDRLRARRQRLHYGGEVWLLDRSLGVAPVIDGHTRAERPRPLRAGNKNHLWAMAHAPCPLCRKPQHIGFCK